MCWSAILDATGYDIEKIHSLAFVGIFVTFIGLISVGFSSPVKPEKQHEKLLQNIEDANKELQKFYIDHPGFKEN